MFIIKEKLIYSGRQSRTSKKTNKSYDIVNFLGTDGESFGVYSTLDFPDDISQLQLVEVVLTFDPKFNSLQLESISIV